MILRCRICQWLRGELGPEGVAFPVDVGNKVLEDIGVFFRETDALAYPDGSRHQEFSILAEGG